jgi:hypothetical protein
VIGDSWCETNGFNTNNILLNDKRLNNTMTLKPYYQLDCPDDLQKTISEKTIDYLKSKYDILNVQNPSLWNKLDVLDFIRAVPELAQYFKTLNLQLREVAFTICVSSENASLHIDELPVVAKINFPIWNTQDSRNLWYSVPAELMSQVTPIINKFGAAYYDLSDVDLAQCQQIVSVEVLKPVVFNSQIPHMIDMCRCNSFPRIVLTCMFFNEPVDFLKD